MPLFLVGKLAVATALKSGRRAVDRVYLAETLDPSRRRSFENAAADRGSSLVFVTTDELTRMTGVENHGGVVAEAGPREFSSMEAFLADVARLDHPPLLFALERFHEPHNLGYALRCLEALGVDGVLLSRKEWGEEEGIIAQSSSGAYDRLPIAPLEEPRNAFRQLEEAGVESLSATAGAVRSAYDFNLAAPVLVAVGGEFRGLSDAVRKACRHSAHIPMTDSIRSFPAGHAATVLASEAGRQRRLGVASGPLWPRTPRRHVNRP